MATSNTVGRLQLLSSPHLYDERSCCTCLHRRKDRYKLLSSEFFPQRSRGSSMRSCGYGKLAGEYIRSSSVLVVSFENMPGRVDTPVDAGVKVSDAGFIPDILDIHYRENNRAAPPVVPCYPPPDENGPTELDFEIYASNSMANYEPPPPPRIPFSFPFEDYYDEAIGVDYISKEEKPANSLLRFLDSLNAKKESKEGGENNTKKPLFSSSISHTEETAEENPLSPGQHSAESKKKTAEENVSSSSIRAMEEFSEQHSVSLQVTGSEATSADGRIVSAESSTAQKSPHSPSPTVAATIKSQDTDKSASFQAILTEEPTDRRSAEDLKRKSLFFTSTGISEEAQAKESSQSGLHRSSEPMSSQTGLSDDIVNAHTPTFPQNESTQKMKGNLGERGFDHIVDKSLSWENAEVSEMLVDQIHSVTSVDTERECFTSTQALDSSKEALPTSQFYVPKEGDLVLGAVTFMNDQKVDLEIGAELSALMPLRGFQPLHQDVSSIIFEISSKDGSSVPLGESLLVKDEIAFNSLSSNAMVDIGTIVIAEVIGKTIIDGRAILSCKSTAQKLSWHRIDQLMRLGEAVRIKIMQWNEGGLLGYFEGVRAFIPRSELLQKPESIAFLKNYVGRTLSVAVLQTDRQTSNIIASEVQAWMSKNLQLGTVHDVTVARVHTYGMQVEIDNTKIRGFVHKSNFSKEYVSSASTYFSVGDKARAMLIKGRDSTKVSFSLADLEKENGLLLRDKEQVFRDAEEMGRRFREGLSEQEKRIFGVLGRETSLDFQVPAIANLAWLHIQNAVP